MSEEIALAAADLETVAELRRALDVAMEENDGWRAVVQQLQQSHHDAWILIGRIDMALELLPKKPSLRQIQLLVTKMRREIAAATKASAL